MTGRSADAMLGGPIRPPFAGSVAVTNAQLAATLTELGYATRRLPTPRLTQAIPLGHADTLVRRGAGPAVDLALYDDEGLSVRPPSRRWARRTAILCHGVLKNPGAWLGNPEIDLFIANSPYLAAVVRSLLALPDWRHRACLDARAFDIVTEIRLPLPCIVHEDGLADFGGAEVPVEILKLCDEGVALGHALQRGKADWFATLSILFHLNLRARAEGAGPIRLVVLEADLTRRVRAEIEATLEGADFGLEDLFAPVPHLSQPALFTLMRRCRFGLAYNTFPEPFGFQVLESIHNSCPIYTNGIGNNRHLLPEAHGIEVLEDSAMALDPGSSAPYAKVADTIFADLGDPQSTRERCARGRELIRSTWSQAAFRQSLALALDRLDGPLPPAADFESLVIAPSPLVRGLDLDTGAVLCDHANQVLTPDRRRRAAELLGRRCGDLSSVESNALEDLQSLFLQGVLTLFRTT